MEIHDRKSGEKDMHPGREEKTVDLRLRKVVFFPPWLLLVFLVAVSLINSDAFVSGLDIVTDWMIDSFAWMFNLTTLACVFTVIIVWFSPLGKVRIGGSKAQPKMKYIDLIFITLCTTVAAAILLWACAEPLYHLYAPSENTGLESGSDGASIFAMETMFLEWTWSPYSLYTVPTLMFAFVFYNMNQPFSVGSALVPVFGEKVKKYRSVIDIIVLYSLVLGMAASLGMGTLTLAGGIENLFGFESGPKLWAVLIAVIAATFITSSVSGVMRGIRKLSSLNIKIYIVLLVFLFIFGPTRFILNFSTESYGAYLRDFFQLSLITGEAYGDEWAKSWPIFYWCNWMAWALVTAVFLGKILKGYTVRQAIMTNFVIPSLFSTIWCCVFSSSAIYYEQQGAGLYELLLENGEGSVVYGVFDQMPFSTIIIVFYLFIVFISFVTAADSNTNVVAGLCTDGITQEEQESKPWLKILWGVSIAFMTWLLICFAGVDGIKEASNLGGFPNMFLILLMMIGLLKVSQNPAKYDVHKEDYDEHGHPIPSPQPPVEGIDITERGVRRFVKKRMLRRKESRGEGKTPGGQS